MKKRGFIQSLRAQLPISFAGVALLTTTMIGAALYFIIWNYYTGLEKNYLDGNVHGTANNLTRIAENSEISSDDSLMDFQDVFQDQVKVTAFLIQSRVRILDKDLNEIADSGSPSKSWKITMPGPQSANNQPPPREESKGEQISDNEMIPGDDANDGTSSSSEAGQAAASDNSPSFSLEPSDDQRSQNDNPPAYSLQANPDMFGFQLMQDATREYDSRSSVIMTGPFYDKDKNILGYVELSEGPDYGRRIISNVLRGWAIASLIGIFVATTFGYFMSRRLTKPLVDLEQVASEMKDGNYEIRSPIYKPTELASLSDTFNQMAAHIQHSIETLRQFVSDAAHEIRTPLTSLRADLNLALSEETVEKTEPIIQRSLQQVERLDQLSKDLLDLSKLESKGERIAPEKINLRDKLLEICEIHASAAEQANVDFQVNLQKGNVYINGDASQLQRAVSNLLNNAVKFTPPDGYVTLKMFTESQSVLILVEDSGIGIPVDDRERLFNRFHRGKNTQNYPGSGLGLAISKAIVEKHGGDIGIFPNKEKTIFFIRLPLAADSK